MLGIYFFLRGHNSPGGGFIGGLVVATAVQLQILSRGDVAVRQAIGRYLHPILGIGLIIAAGAAASGLFAGTLFKSIWLKIPLGPVELEIGTPVLFDLGVFLVVIAVVTSYLLGLSREDHRWFP
jgi:multisubunit Na+/H+ antiporter MnhB subunit